MCVHRYELRAHKKLSESCAIIVFLRWLGMPHEGKCIDGSIAEMGIGICSNDHLRSLLHFTPHLEGPFEQPVITCRCFGINSGSCIEDHEQHVYTASLIADTSSPTLIKDRGGEYTALKH